MRNRRLRGHDLIDAQGRAARRAGAGGKHRGRKATPWCGLLVVDLRNGDIVEWLQLGEGVPQLFDVAVLPMMRCPTAVAPDSAELQETITMEVVA